MIKKVDYGYLEPLESEKDGKKYIRVTHGPDEASHQHYKKLRKLNFLLEEIVGTELLFDEFMKAANLIYPIDDLRFELGPRERDSSKLNGNIKALNKSAKKIKETIDELNNLAPPSHLDFVAARQRLEDVLNYVELQIKLHEELTGRLAGRSNIRAIRVAKALRVVFERYSKLPVLVTKDEDIQPSVFCSALKQVYELIDIQADTYEPARAAKNCSEKDADYKYYRSEIEKSDGVKTEHAYRFCKESLSYIFNDDDDRIRLGDSSITYI